jgi:hypothetical protein
MTTAQYGGKPAIHRRSHAWVPRTWDDILDFALILWVVRVPLCALVVGVALLCLVPQAQDLLVELIESYGRIALFFLLLFFVWASTTHYAARLLLASDQRFRIHAEKRHSKFLDFWELWVPRVLGAATFVAVVISAERSIEDLPLIEDDGVISAIRGALRLFELATVVVLAVFLWYVINRRSLNKLGFVRRMNARAGFVTDGLRAVGIESKLEESNLGPLVLVIVFLMCAGVLMFAPNRVAEWFPRGLAVPVILGAWLPFLSFLSGLGRRFQAPIILGLIALVTVLAVVFGDNHSIRRIDAAQTLGRGADFAPLSLNRAVELWIDANDCKADPSRCPRPIIIAAAGGASRAGFFTVSIIGFLLDSAKERNPQLTEAAVAKRLFAISGVSGGSVGAVMVAAALARADASGKQSCVESKPSLWYGGQINNWRDCFEALMAGDFLTADTVGLVFRDTVRFGWWQDRAATLEKSWEDRFAEVMGADQKDWQSRCPGDLRCPFLTMRPQPGHWLPLLVLNGVSAATGRRISTTVLGSDYDPKERCPVSAVMTVDAATKSKARPNLKSAVSGPAWRCAIFMESVRFHALLANDAPPDWRGWIQRLTVWDYVRDKLTILFHPQNLNDIRLSTAAHNSARFPIVSPPGAIRNRQHQIVDRIVDGGYFENYGALSAMELAQAVHAIEPKLAPFVLVVSNDPDEDPDLTKVDVPDDVALTDLTVPISAVANTRTSRGRLAVDQLEAVMDGITSSTCGDDTAHIRVWPQFRPSKFSGGDKKVSIPVSMSWWLSRPIQILLHQQTEAPTEKNQNQNQDQIERVWRAIESNSDCIAAKRG